MFDKNETSKYEMLIEQEIKRDEEGSGNNNSSEIPHVENTARFTLGDLLSMLGDSGDTAFVSLVSKIHELLGQVGKKGLDEEGKKSIELLVQDLNKFSPKIGPIVEKAIRQYGYSLDVDIPIEGALIGYFGFVTYRISSTRKELLAQQDRKQDNSEQGGEAWQ